MHCTRVAAAVVIAALASSADAQTDTSHFMQIERVIGGVDGDTAAQAVQLRLRRNNQNQVSGRRIMAYDSAGLNRVDLLIVPTDVANALEGDRILFCTPDFIAYTDPPAEPDFLLNSPIPASYLSAGRIVWGGPSNALWALAWGGAAYTGSNLGAATNDPDGDFGPAFDGPLPSSGFFALAFTGPAGAFSSTNAEDYAYTGEPAVFTNNARQSFTLKMKTAKCYPDCDMQTGPGVLDIFDFLCFGNHFANNDPYACECDTSTGPGVCDIFDFLCFGNAFAQGCP